MEQPGKPDRQKVLFVINHKSGTGGDNTLKDLISDLSKSGNLNCRMYNMAGDDEEMIRAEILKFKPSIVAAAGGDGTVKLLATILANTKTALAIIPYGSANGMAKELNVPAKPEQALALITGGKRKLIDMVEINGDTCIHLADVGLNARIVKRFENDTKRGILTYAKHLFGEMFLLKNYKLQISYDGKNISRKAVSITFANASKYGTGAVINPGGILDDGKFELVIVKPFPRIKLLSIAWKMFVGRLHTSDYVEIISCKKARVLISKKTTLQVDGEVIGKVKDITASIMSKAITVMVPKVI
jgi:diacylglycerol kinase (ATP)